MNLGMVRLSRHEILTCSLSKTKVDWRLSEEREILLGYSLGEIEDSNSLEDIPVRSPIERDLASESYFFLGLSRWVLMSGSSLSSHCSLGIVIVFFIKLVYNIRRLNAATEPTP